jgi:predicted transcriptional regulator
VCSSDLVFSALSVDTASDKLKIEWIEKELKQLHEELQKINKTFDEQDEVGDPFEGLEVK